MALRNILPVQYVWKTDMSPIVVLEIMHVGYRKERRCGCAERAAALKGMAVKGSSIFGLNQAAADMRHGGALKALQVFLKERCVSVNRPV